MFFLLHLHLPSERPLALQEAITMETHLLLLVCCCFSSELSGCGLQEAVGGGGCLSFRA